MATSIPIIPVITQGGLNAAKNADLTGFALGITHIAFGTAQYTPVGDETALQLEKKRFPIIGGSATGPSTIQIYVEALADLADPFFCGEIGFYAGTTLFAIFSRTSSPVLYMSDTVTMTTSYALGLSALPAGSVTVVVDPSAAGAAALLGLHVADPNPHPQYMQDAADILPPGLTGQVLVQQSNTRGDAAFQNITSGLTINVNTQEEEQTLGAGTVVTLALRTTNGMVAHVGGARLSRSEYTINSSVQFTLSRAYPGQKIIVSQNEVAGQIINPLDSTRNLSDVANVATARTNLGVPASANGAHTGVTTIDQALVKNYVGVKALKSLTGSGAVLVAVISGGVVTGVTVSNGGSGYTTPDIVFAGGGGIGAKATATVVGGVITAVTVTAGGSAYATAPTATAVVGQLNLSTADTFKVSVDASASLSFAGPPAGNNVFQFTLITVNDATAGRALAFPIGIRWAGGSMPPRTTAANARDVWTFYTEDGGATYGGSLSIQNEA